MNAPRRHQDPVERTVLLVPDPALALSVFAPGVGRNGSWSWLSLAVCPVVEMGEAAIKPWVAENGGEREGHWIDRSPGGGRDRIDGT